MENIGTMRDYDVGRIYLGQIRGPLQESDHNVEIWRKVCRSILRLCFSLWEDMWEDPGQERTGCDQLTGRSDWVT